MEQRSTGKGRSDNYLEARGALLSRAHKPSAAPYMWLESVEGALPDTIDYTIHASGDAKSVPPFAIEVYHQGDLQSYEVRRDVIRELSLMPEELRLRIVQAQKAVSLIDRMVLGAKEPARESALAP